ncbi:MAG: RecX family transcriptional regulator [Bacteroidaceae bacterium]|nr:RecX family transcriptional regulator [Bacteroidaceae bacterium]
MKKPLTPGEALNKAAAYCTLCERCISEVSAKLTTWGVPYAVQEEIITRLTNEKFIDEARYCRAFVNDKVRFNRWGRLKITAALREKRLPQEYIKEAMENIDEDAYQQSLQETIDIKRRELKGKDDFATQQKIIRHAASRGYEPSLIIKAINYSGDEMDF